MSGLLEVVVLHQADAQRAEAGGADRVELRGSVEHDGRAPTPAMVETVRGATSLQLRPLVRLRDGFGTDGGEVTRLIGLISSYLDAGSDGVVLGFVNGLGEVDTEVITALVGDLGFAWTFDRAIDSCLDADRAWSAVRRLPGLDQVLTAGSARDVEHGLDELVRRARSDPGIARLIMAGGGLHPDHVPWLVRAGVRAFHIGAQARPQSSWKAYVDESFVRSWRTLLDSEIRHVAS